MTKLCTRDHQNVEVHHFRHPEVWNDAIALGYLDRQNDYNAVPQPEVYRNIFQIH